MSFRTDAHNNPTAFTTDIAKEAGLEIGVDYTQGDPFSSGGHTYYTARLIGDPLFLTIRVISRIGFRNSNGAGRWTYINIPFFLWNNCDTEMKIRIIHDMYKYEGGISMMHLFDSPPLPGDIKLHVNDQMAFKDKVG